LSLASFLIDWDELLYALKRMSGAIVSRWISQAKMAQAIAPQCARHSPEGFTRDGLGFAQPSKAVPVYNSGIRIHGSKLWSANPDACAILTRVLGRQELMADGLVFVGICKAHQAEADRCAERCLIKDAEIGCAQSVVGRGTNKSDHTPRTQWAAWVVQGAL
jgi:hypothetical protein